MSIDFRAELKRCPFCGSPAVLEDERLIYVVRCTSCSACVLGERAPEPDEDLPDGYWEPFRQSAVDRWNRRAALAEPEPPTGKKITETKRTEKQKKTKVDPNVEKMEKLMDMRLDGIAWFLAEHHIKNDTETQP
jgi:hypothetical protein